MVWTVAYCHQCHQKYRHLSDKKPPSFWQPVKLQEGDIAWSNTAKYLGVTFDKALSWQPHIEQKRKAGRTSFTKLWPLLNRKCAMSAKNKLRLYQSTIAPSPIWGNTSPFLIKKLQFQNRVLRSVIDAPWYVTSNQLHRDLNVCTVTEQIQHQAKAFFESINAHTLDEMRQLLSSYDEKTLLKRRRHITIAL